jgi:hypothetical protein
MFYTKIGLLLVLYVLVLLGSSPLFGARLYLLRIFVTSSVCLGKLFCCTALDAFISFLVYFR